MDSYSVDEAAAALGIPEGRVWELLARGVLAGSAEVGGDMRVFLRGAALVETPHTDPGARGSNGGGNGHGELSPFRELLTEFRNLTERYGQALLALGESRGEVAALRGRVDLLEVRLDQRASWPPAPSTWTASPAEAEITAPVSVELPALGEVAEPEPQLEPKPVAEPVAHAEPEPQPEPEADLVAQADAGEPGESEHAEEPSLEPESALEPELEAAKHEPHSRSRSREAIAGFAAALARAEDPTAAEVIDDFEGLPGTQETADALAAYRRETTGKGPIGATEEIEQEVESPPVSVVREGYSTDTPEPDWIAEEDLLVPSGALTDDEGAAEQPAAVVGSAQESAGEEPEITAATADTLEPIEPPEPVTLEPMASAAPAEAPEPSTAEPIEPLDVPEPIEAREPIELPASPDVPEPQASDEPAIPLERIDSEPITSPARPTWLEPEDLPEPIPSPEPIASAEPAEPAEPAEAREPVAMADVSEAAPQGPSRDTNEPEPTPKGSPMASVEIAAEPPAKDDVALLVGPPEFSEPPIVPPEPAFWEPEAWSRAPFAIDAWDTHPAESRQDQKATVLADEPAWPDETVPPPKTAALPVGTDPAPARPETPWSSASSPASPQSEPTGAAATPASSSPRPRPARRRRSPAERAIRRLKLLLD
jgi:nicotinate-nucleotide--dimethylbenzimidazole phosphoribosyltransferase